MKILLIGAAGQLGQAMRQQLPAEVELISTSRSGDIEQRDFFLDLLSFVLQLLFFDLQLLDLHLDDGIAPPVEHPQKGAEGRER